MTPRTLPILFLLVFFTGGNLTQDGQLYDDPGIDRPLRIEIPAKSPDETYRVFPVDSAGVILCFRSVETVQDTMTKWYFSMYDKNLRRVWVKSIPVRSGLDLIDYCREKKDLALIFLGTAKSKELTGAELILRLDVNSGNFTGIRRQLQEPVAVLKSRRVGNRLFLGYTSKTKTARMQILDLETGKSADHPLTSPVVFSSITGFLPDPASNAVYVTYRRISSRNSMESRLGKINLAGVLISETILEVPLSGWDIHSPQLVLTRPDEVLIVAMYAPSRQKSSRKTGNLSPSYGFYTTRVKNGIQTEKHVYTFSELKSSVTVIGEKEMMTMRRKALKKNRSISGYSPEMNVVAHPLIPYGDRFILTVESYHPEYHPESLTEFDFYGRPYINTYNVFDGYRYTNAIVTCFDESGSMVWDNSMEIRNLISSELVPRVNIHFGPDGEQVICYSAEGRIASKIIRESEVVEKLDFSSVELLNPQDKMISEKKGNMLPWYGSYFLCSGYQEVKNINASDTKRLVFYLTKVRFE